MNRYNTTNVPSVSFPTEKVELTSGASGWTGVAKSIVSCSVASFILENKGWYARGLLSVDPHVSS